MKRTSVILLGLVLAFLVAGVVMAAEYTAYHNLKVTVPEVIKLELSKAGEEVLFDDIEGAGTYTTKESFTLTYRCNKKTNWQLKVSAGKFIAKDSQEELPVSKLNIKIGGTDKTYNILNQEVVIDKFEVTGPKEKTLEFRYELQIDDFDSVYAGEYINEVTYTLFVP